MKRREIANCGIFIGFFLKKSSWLRGEIKNKAKWHSLCNVRATMNSSRCLASYLIIAMLALVSSPAFCQVSISIDIAPPPLVVDDQPACPDDGYLWTPGYWAYDDGAGEYYWVPGAWVQPPEVGLLWTPAYWGWSGNAYAFYPGYWGPTIGFYGGVNYGHGYWGSGYGGGRWEGGHFAYNTAANNVSRERVHNVYEDRSVVRSTSNRVSFNGGKGGISAQPTPQEQQASQQSHIQATPQQQTHFQTAAQTRSHQVKVNAHQPSATPGAQPAPQPAANPQGSQPFTGEKPQAQNKDQGMERKTPPVQTQSAVSPNNQIKTEEKPNVTNEKPAPESRLEQNPNADLKPHNKETFAPDVHPQSQPKPEAKPEAKPQPHDKPQPKSEPQGKPEEKGKQDKPDAQGSQGQPGSHP